MKKVAFEILVVEVEKMYSKTFPEGADRQIEEHCEAIRALIEGAGWTTEEYFQHWFYDGKN